MVQVFSPEQASETKGLLREKVKSLRDGLDGRAIERMSVAVVDRLFSFEDFKKSSKVLLYLSLKREVQTEKIIEKCFAAGKRVFVPVMDIKNDALLVSELAGREVKLEMGAFGVREPGEKDRKIVSPDILDLAIIPGLAFDRKGARLGKGKGYYDRFLGRLSPTVCRLGLAFDFQILDFIPQVQHDVGMHKILTESDDFHCLTPEGV